MDIREYVKRALFKLDKILWAIRYRTINRYHMLNLQQKDGTIDDYRYGWIDSDKQIVYACFNILCNFVEKEWEGGFPYQKNWDDLNENERMYFEKYNASVKEVETLYKYWKVDRVKKLKSLKDDTFPTLKDEEDFLKKEEEFLIRLIKIKGFLWE